MDEPPHFLVPLEKHGALGDGHSVGAGCLGRLGHCALANSSSASVDSSGSRRVDWHPFLASRVAVGQVAPLFFAHLSHVGADGGVVAGHAVGSCARELC